MDKEYKSMKDLMDALSDDKTLKDDVRKEVGNRTLSRFLFALRCERNLTQGELAKKIGCSQSWVSKIEGAYDEDLTVKDLLDYGKALDLQLELGYRQKNVRLVDLVNYHLDRLKQLFNQLTSLAKDDDSMGKGVFGVFADVFYSMLDNIKTNVAKLDIAKQRSVNESKESIHISTPLKDKLEHVEEEKSSGALCHCSR